MLAAGTAGEQPDALLATANNDRVALDALAGAYTTGHVAAGEPGAGQHHHADGAWLVLYAWLRLEAGLPPCVAYEEAIRRGSDVRWTASIADHAAQSVA